MGRDDADGLRRGCGAAREVNLRGPAEGFGESLWIDYGETLVSCAGQSYRRGVMRVGTRWTRPAARQTLSWMLHFQLFKEKSEITFCCSSLSRYCTITPYTVYQLVYQTKLHYLPLL